MANESKEEEVTAEGKWSERESGRENRVRRVKFTEKGRS